MKVPDISVSSSMSAGRGVSSVVHTRDKYSYNFFFVQM